MRTFGTTTDQRFRLQLVLATVLVFAVLVAAKLHGSSIALAAAHWDPVHAADHYVASPILDRMSPSTAANWRRRLMAQPAPIRADEYGQATPWALAQLTHDPPFPVINTNMGNGQNMLLVHSSPVLHIATLVRPSTWGYLLFGADVGLAWSWWFQPLACFVALFLLFELIVPRERWLCVFGAMWYCTSAYVVAWSLWPAYYTALGAFATVCGYRLLQTKQRSAIFTAGVGLGLSVSGFAILLYPPWQVPLALAFVAILVGLFSRDRLHENLRARTRWLALSAAVAIAVALLGSFLSASSEAIAALVNSSYPGQRRLLGGDCSAARLFGALYNGYTNQLATRFLNQSEDAGFYLCFPGVIVAGLVSGRIRRGLGWIGWLLAGLTLFFVIFCVTEIPEWLASVTLMSRVQGFRAQIAVGLTSIVLSLLLISSARGKGGLRRRALWTAGAVFCSSAALYLWLGWQFQKQNHYFATDAPIPTTVLNVSLLAAGTTAAMALGLARLVAGIVLVCTTLTSWHFNPLSRGLSPIKETELGQAITRVVESDPADANGRRWLWLTYGGPMYPNAGTIAQVMGARTLSGVHHHPQVDLWKELDPEEKHLTKYNRYAQVYLLSLPEHEPEVHFSLPLYLRLNVHASPLHPGFRKLGARYVLTFGAVPHVAEPALDLRYTSRSGGFAIWQLPDTPLSAAH